MTRYTPPSSLVTDAHYEHIQGPASATWVVVHGLNKKPSVTVIASSGNITIGEVNYDTLNQLTITFGGAFSGSAYLN